MNCEHRVELNWPSGRPPIAVGLCGLQGHPPVHCPRFKQECSVYIKEYNLDTSAGHPVKDDDIVRHSFEKRRSLG